MFELDSCENALALVLGIMVVLYLVHRFVLCKDNRGDKHHEDRTGSGRL